MIRLAGAVLLAALLASPALADELGGTEAVRAKSTTARTVFLGDGVYRVTEGTVMRDERGHRIALSELDVPDLAPGESPPALAARLARFEAERSGTELLLRSLDVLPRPD